MLVAVSILVVIAGILFCLSLLPSVSERPFVAVAGLLLAVGLFLLGAH